MNDGTKRKNIEAPKLGCKNYLLTLPAMTIPEGNRYQLFKQTEASRNIQAHFDTDPKLSNIHYGLFLTGEINQLIAEFTGTTVEEVLERLYERVPKDTKIDQILELTFNNGLELVDDFEEILQERISDTLRRFNQ